MKTGWAIRLIAIALLVLSCSATFADCHGGGCLDDCDCSGDCAHFCRCALLQFCSVDVILTVTLFLPDNGVLVPHFTGTDIFRPPKSLA